MSEVQILSPRPIALVSRTLERWPAAGSAKLNAEIVKIMRDPAASGPLTANGFEVVASTPAEFGARLKGDVQKFDEIVRKSGAKVD